MSSTERAYLKLVPAPEAAPSEPAAPSEALAPGMDDSELRRALREGDPSAASALYDRTQRVVHRTIHRLLGRSDCDAEDVAQLAFIELVNTIGGFRGDCPLDAWVSVVSARVVYKHIRRRRLERQLFSAIPAEALSLASESTRRDLVFRDALRQVLSHLAEVDVNRSWTFLLHDVYGYDLKEIASITSVSVAAAQSRLVRGRREVHDRIHADPELAAMIRDLCGTEDDA